MGARLLILAAVTLVVIPSHHHLVHAQLPTSNPIVAFNNAAQSDVRTLGIQNQISAKVRDTFCSGTHHRNTMVGSIASTLLSH